MHNTKDQLRSMIETLPNNCTVENAIYKLYVIHKIQQGEDDIRRGRVIAHDKVAKEMSAWLSKLSGPKRRRKS